VLHVPRVDIVLARHLFGEAAPGDAIAQLVVALDGLAIRCRHDARV